MEKRISIDFEVPEFKTMFRELVAEALQAAGLNQEEPDQVLTVAEVLTEFQITKPTLTRLRKKGVIPYFNLGKNVRFSRRDVYAALKSYEHGKRKPRNSTSK